MSTAGEVLVLIALVLAVAGLVLFHDRPGRRWWQALTAAALVAVVLVVIL